MNHVLRLAQGAGGLESLERNGHVQIRRNVGRDLHRPEHVRGRHGDDNGVGTARRYHLLARRITINNHGVKRRGRCDRILILIRCGIGNRFCQCGSHLAVCIRGCTLRGPEIAARITLEVPKVPTGACNDGIAGERDLSTFEIIEVDRVLI